MRTILFINWYNEKNQKRAGELIECLNKNCECKAIDFVINISDVQAPHPKVIQSKYIPRLTFADYFHCINATVTDNDISIIANLDIYFDETLSAVKQMKKDDAYALTRYDVDGDKTTFFNRTDSQDVWIFKGKIKPVNDAEFYLGIPGCDNAIADRLQRAGYNVTNPSLTVKTYHLHSSNIRNYMNAKGQSVVKPVSRPYKLLTPWEIGKHKLSIYHIGMYAEREQQHYLRTMLSMLGDYYEDDWEIELKKRGKDGFRKYVIERSQKADIVFMQLQTPNVLDVNTVKRMCGFIINWTGDVRYPLPSWYIDLGKHVGLTLFTNETDVKAAKAAGVIADYFQITDDDTIYTPNGWKSHNGNIVFMGNHYPGKFPLTQLRFDLCQRLKKEFGNEFSIFGGGFPAGMVTANLNFKQEDEAATYRGCKIAVNCSHFNYERYSSNRIFRIMLSGAFCLSHHYDRIDEDFEINKHLVTWRTIDELVDKCKYYLSHDDERNAIAKAGYAHVLRNHGIVKRADELKTLLGIYHNKLATQ